MKIATWRKNIKGMKKFTTTVKNVKCNANNALDMFMVFTEKICSKCGQQEESESVSIQFKACISGGITVFEANMLYAIYVEKKLPYDYASYHECIAGKRFIENIARVHL